MVFPAHHFAQVDQKHLRTPLRPAQTLLPQSLQRLRHQDPAQRARLEKDIPVAQLELPADVDIFGDHVRAPVPDVRQRLSAKGGNDAGDGKDPAIDPLRPLDEPNDGRKLAHLNAANQRGARANARVPGNSPDVRVLNQRRYQIGSGVAVQQGVAVNADQQIAPGRRRPGFERHGFPLVLREVNHPQARLLQRQLVQHLCGVVRRAVVDGDHFYILVPLSQRGANGLSGVSFLIEAGDQNGDKRLAGKRRSGRVFIP